MYLATIKSHRDLTQAQKSVLAEMGCNSSVCYGTEVNPPTEKQLSTTPPPACPDDAAIPTDVADKQM